MSEKILITSALPYANGPLHFGHIAGAYLPADCYARFQRLMRNEVLYICGSDEYGVAISLSAEIAGRTPKEHVEIFHHINQKLFQTLDFSFDHFSRTTWSGHTEVVQQFFLDLLHNGYIEEKVTNQLYSEQDRKFLADRYVVGTCPKCGFEQARGDECPKCGASYEATDLKNPRSKLTNQLLVLKPSKHWFMRFDLFKDQLLEWISKKRWKPNVLHFAQGYIDELRPRAITRDTEWGIPVPLKEANGKVLYVWFDAPIGYISATKEWAKKIKNPEKWKDFWLDPETKLVQFIGKDNIPFHAVFFPAMIMGQNIPYKIVDELPANEFLNLEGKQFSKSEGWYVDLEDFFKNFTSDQIRYYLASHAPETQDSEFSWKEFQFTCNADLVGKFGNLVHRVLTFSHQHLNGKVAQMAQFSEEDRKFIERLGFLAEETRRCYEHFHLRKACQTIMELASWGNSYFDHQKPWVLAKDAKKKKRMGTVIACCLECIKVLAIISFPIIPQATNKIWKMIGFDTNLKEEDWRLQLEEKLEEGQGLGKPEVVFKKIEDETIEKEIAKLKNIKEVNPAKIEITFDEFKKMDLRVGEIVSAAKIEKSKKLLHFIVNLGVETRSIVSGIAEHVENPNSLVGKKVIVVANLKPAKLMGVESQGMILAVDTHNTVEIISPSLGLPGEIVR
ncbi:MAG: methionine--tRNA ligase [Chlamydiae bacterium]|nr:methionine--tRNA ligase [Chlamydiota bacterium]